MIVSLKVFEKLIRLETSDRFIRQLVLANFGAMVVPNSSEISDLNCTVRRSGPYCVLEQSDRDSIWVEDDSELIYSLEKQITVDLQNLRRDLFFLHSAAVEFEGKAYLLAADSGSGKSTTTWALLHHGFRYLSDELAPIDLKHQRVLPYSHAICLKQAPPLPYALPTSALNLGRTIHIPATAFPSVPVDSARAIGGILFLKYAADRVAPLLTRLGRADAAQRMYVAALNALAHADYGLAPASVLVANIPCFEILTAGLPESCALIQSLAENPGLH